MKHQVSSHSSSTYFLMSGWGYFLIQHNYVHNFSHNSTMALSCLTKLTMISRIHSSYTKCSVTVSAMYSAVHLMESGATRSVAFVMTSLGSFLPCYFG